MINCNTCVFSGKNGCAAVFQYCIGEKTCENRTQELYSRRQIDLMLKTGNIYPIWVNPNYPNVIRYDRFYGIARGIFFAVLGLLALAAASAAMLV